MEQTIDKLTSNKNRNHFPTERRFFLERLILKYFFLTFTAIKITCYV